MPISFHILDLCPIKWIEVTTFMIQDTRKKSLPNIKIKILFSIKWRSNRTKTYLRSRTRVSIECSSISMANPEYSGTFHCTNFWQISCIFSRIQL